MVKRGHEVTAVSRRGVNPKPDSKDLSRVNWVKGDATDMKTVEKVLKDSDAAVHAIGTWTYSKHHSRFVLFAKVIRQANVCCFLLFRFAL